MLSFLHKSLFPELMWKIEYSSIAILKIVPFKIFGMMQVKGAFVAGLEDIVMILELLDEEKAYYEFRSQLSNRKRVLK